MGIDWSSAPDGADFYCGSLFYKTDEHGNLLYFENDWWHESMYSLRNRKELKTYEPRPAEQQWPETEDRINNIGRNRTLDDMGHYNRNADEAFGDELSVYATAKHDSDKPRYDLLPPVAIDLMAQVMTFGAKKYKPEGWRTVPDALQRYQAAMLRHAFAIQRGELIDAESGLPHAAHVMCCAAFIAELQGEK
jgi:hypothetical protein